MGAHRYAFDKYNTYKIYMFIQDTTIPTKRITDLDILLNNDTDNIIYTFEYDAYLGTGGYIENLRNIYRNSKLSFICNLDEHIKIKGAAHNSFIANRTISRKILELEDVYIDNNIIKTKIDSWLSERTIGIIADMIPCIRKDISSYFNKVCRKRDY